MRAHDVFFFVCSVRFLFAAFVFCLQRSFFVCSIRFLFAAFLLFAIIKGVETVIYITNKKKKVHYWFSKSQIPRMSNHGGFVLLGCVFTVANTNRFNNFYAWFHVSKAQVESRISVRTTSARLVF